MYEIQFDLPARFQKGRVIVWSVLGALFLGIAANFIYGWLVDILLH